MNIYSINEKIATKNLIPGTKVYGEALIESNNEEYRLWDPRRSKLAASLLNGMSKLDIKEDSKVLYLGASSGTTVSHISDLLINGRIYAVEFSPRMMRSLVKLSDERNNIAPILSDATKPKKYINMVEKVDLVYSDVAQVKQTELFMDNVDLYLKSDGLALLMIKARSIDVTQKPQKVFNKESKKLRANGYNILEKIKLEPYEKDHMAILVEKNFY